MKKFLGALVLSLAVSTAALADMNIPWTKEGCESVKGAWLTAHSASDSGCDAAHCNAKNFCGSAVKVNWFSALIWCKSIGHKLASFDSMCPGNLVISGSICQNLKGIETVRRANGYNYYWSTLATSNNNAWGVRLENGLMSDAGGDNAGTKTQIRFALCEE